MSQAIPKMWHIILSSIQAALSFIFPLPFSLILLFCDYFTIVWAGDNHNTCKCKDVDPIGLFTGTKSDFERISLGTISDLKKNLHCSLCQLFVQAMYLGDYEEAERSDTAEVFCKPATRNGACIALYITGRSGEPNGRIRLSPQDAIKVKSELGYPDVSYTLSDLIDDSEDKDNCAVRQGRIDATRIRSWIDCCIRDHGQYCCPPSMKKVHTRMGELPTYLASGTKRRILQLMLVDVLEERLVEHSVSEIPEISYVALSYVWGQTPMLQTTTENLTQLRMPGAFSTKNVTLPRTVRDAMALVKEIGYRFLWVDTLCIVQDDPNKNDQILVMNLIYRRARLTIVAMAGENANSGLPGVMQGTHIETPTVVIDGYKLQAKPPSFEIELKRPRLSTRGWTYQEMLLSPRCLFISPYQYYFRCTIRLWPETWLNYHTSQPVSTLIWPTSSGTPSSDILISGYEHYVEAYTRRQLTYDNDILNAFTAVLEELSLLFSATFYDAIPDTNIVRALLWCPTGDGAPERRSSITNPCADSNPYFPSWSWIGWKGPVTYAGSRFGNSRDLTSMCGLLPQTSLFMKPATTTIFQKIDTSDTKTIKTEQDKVTCRRPNCCATLVATGRTPPITVQDARTTSLAERSPKEHRMGPSPQQLPEKFTKLSILQFRAPTVMANSYYFGKCRYESSTSRYDCVNILPVYDSRRRQCGGFFNPAVHTLTVGESQQFAIIAISVFRTTRLPDEDFVDRHYGFGELNPRKCSCLLHVMLIRFHGEVAERVATGIMHPRAWKDAEQGPEYKLINLA